MFFINAIFWLWIFIIPAGIMSFIGLLLYYKSSQNLPYSILIGIIGIVLGIYLAELVRKKHGFDYFFGILLSTPDIEATNKPDEDQNTINNQ